MEGAMQAQGPLVEEAAVEHAAGGHAEDDHIQEEEERDIPVVEEGNPRMRLTEQEREWALAIKAAVVSDPQLDNLTDFFYAQLALVDKEDVQAALDRVYKIQSFRQEYGIVETTQMAMKYLEEDLELFPGLFLSFTWNLEMGRYVIVVDYPKFEGRVLRQQPGAKKTFMISDYYMGHMMNPDLEAIRKGIFILAECEGFNWRNNFGLDFFREYHTEIAAVYPCNFEAIKYFHTGLAFNLLMSMTKQFMPAAIYSKFQIGCISDFGRLDRLYLVPNLEVANKRFLDRARATLQQYYANSASFSLD